MARRPEVLACEVRESRLPVRARWGVRVVAEATSPAGSNHPGPPPIGPSSDSTQDCTRAEQLNAGLGLQRWRP